MKKAKSQRLYHLYFDRLDVWKGDLSHDAFLRKYERQLKLNGRDIPWLAQTLKQYRYQKKLATVYQGQKGLILE